jgi:hypothetical protein
VGKQVREDNGRNNMKSVVAWSEELGTGEWRHYVSDGLGTCATLFAGACEAGKYAYRMAGALGARLIADDLIY